ncbi:MAG TPA: TetR/AcrR family transcriptional regulator C-terminal domain-containing protein [Alphaproteobacteria bacterium]|nr:TetR/AcrR family transcriptional regulator C-terminal domain-containing protein [Alphaproteobacteria bacterium]
MDPSKTDRRVKYTKKMLTDSLVGLLQHQHISSISVKELCELADINRSTFYTHYRDAADLLSQIEAEVYENVKRHIEKQGHKEAALPVSQQMLTSILEYAKDNVELFKALLSENCDFAFQKDILELSEIISSRNTFDVDARIKDYLRTFSIAGCISLFQEWLKSGAIESPAWIAEMTLRFLQKGVAAFLPIDA